MSTSWRDLCRGLVVAGLSLGAGWLLGCDLIGQYPWQVRVPITDVGAQFTLADVTWFEEEQTLFVFYRIEAREGLSINSQVELEYRTDEVNQEFVALDELTPVHNHVPVFCGPHGLCGSFSLHVELQPRDVDLQLRYHRDGELALDADTTYNVVLRGAPHTNRSAVVYGVFDEENIHVQWRLRNQFPAIRNEEATELGLRRRFTVQDSGWGDLTQARDRFSTNPYGYGMFGECPDTFSPHASPPVTTLRRAAFDPVELPEPSYPLPFMCGRSTVTDATGDFTTVALAQKNPQTRPAFDTLRTPVVEPVQIPVMLQVCNDPTSIEHREMQQQRLFLQPTDAICIDDWDVNGFPGRLATDLSAMVDAVRAEFGRDMVLVVALNRPNNRAIAEAVEAAFSIMVPPENERSTPRLSGVFMFDSFGYVISDPAVARLVLWCPSNFNSNDLDAIPDTSARSCAVQATTEFPPGNDVSLGSLPILPTEPQFEDFIQQYGVGQTGRMTALNFKAPTRTPTTENVPLGDFAVVTFFNGEQITPAIGDGFSYCADDDTGLVVFRLGNLPDIPDILPLSLLGELHPQIPISVTYELGLLWDFPFLLQAEYEQVVAGGAGNRFGFTIGFGFGTPAEAFLGGFLWEQDEFDLSGVLEQCTAYCDHPTFDSSGVYNVTELFSPNYASRCYRPQFPQLDDDGFPPDP